MNKYNFKNLFREKIWPRKGREGNYNNKPAEYRFGFSLVLVILALAFVLVYKDYLLPALCFSLMGLLLIGLAVFRPVRLRLVYQLWMSGSTIIGNIIFKAILILFYYLIITPIGFLGRILGKNFLLLKIDKNKKTYWISREDLRIDKHFYERPY